MRIAASGVLAVLAGFSQSVLAHECDSCPAAPASASFWPSDWNPSFYASAGFQNAMFEDWDTISNIDPASQTSRSEDDSDTGYRVSAGMSFLEHFGVELTYADFGEATLAAQSDGSGQILAAGPQHDAVELDGFGLHLIARVPLGKEFSLAGRAGLWLWNTRQRISGSVQNPPGSGTPVPAELDDSKGSTRFGWGAGLDYDGFKPFRVTLAYEASTFEAENTEEVTGASDIRALNLSVAYFF